ncbi:hypothetical protein C5D98_14860 [Rathayibacter rathayi]|uniref:hypothetical protein n=1 Tax=Rathayibacter rathayi TaxID=33887 RepID=UPI000CE8CB23|nr:hypothetical protein [Rathayibacter rathayi]PPG77462.1 hypothetical protein C5C15_09205 [Rathayibacter rathayi]PPI65230.1 hypothetical protein C5D98_14860 [Rathayibacter rathayi]
MSSIDYPEYPTKVAAALDLIRDQCLSEEWLDIEDLPDRDSAWRYVTDSCYLPDLGTGHGKPGAGEFEDYGDKYAHAYLLVLAFEILDDGRRAEPDNEHAGELDQDAAWDVEVLIQARTGHQHCPHTGMSHRIGGTVLAPICLDCEILN